MQTKVDIIEYNKNKVSGNIQLSSVGFNSGIQIVFKPQRCEFYKFRFWVSNSVKQYPVVHLEHSFV